MKLSLKRITTTVVVAFAVMLSAIGIFGTPTYAANPCGDSVITTDKGVLSGSPTPACTVCVSSAMAAGKSAQEALTSCRGGAGAVNVDNVWKMARDIINWILIAAGIIAVGFIIWAGIRYVMSGGDAEKVKKAKNTLLYAIIGLLIAALALIIVNLVINIGTDVTTTTPGGSGGGGL